MPALLYSVKAFESRIIAQEIEGRLHRLFRAKRTNGEWFDITPAEAWTALKRQRALRLINAQARADSSKRWQSDEPHDLTDILFGAMTLEQVRDRDDARKIAAALTQA